MSDHNNNLGRFFEDYAVGDIITHATPRTLTEADASLYISIYPTRFALQSSKEFAKSCMMIAAEIYGTTFKAKMLILSRAPPENKLNNSKIVP